MHKIHELLSQKSQAYSKWHQHPAHSLAHWTVFIAAAVLITSSVVSEVNAANLAVASQSNNSSASVKGLANRVEKAPAQDHILVKFKDNVGQAKKAEVLAKHGLSEKSEIKQIGVKIININTDENTAEEVIQRLISEKDVEFAEVDGALQAGAVPNDPYYSSQWHLSNISLPPAWDVSSGSPSVIVAVIDSGVDMSHPDLTTKLVSGWNFLNGTSNTQDSGALGGHGTAVSGTVGAATDNSNGVAGVGWNVSIMPLLVLSSSNYASWSNVASAITYAADHGAKVINISIYGSSYSSTMQSAVNYAWNKGLVIFACAGNEANNILQYPAALQNVIAVSASNSGNTLEGFSSYGDYVDFAAPGSGITTTYLGSSYAAWSGTSFSSPITAGVAALLFSAKPTLSNSQVVNMLVSTADDLGTPGWDQYYGHGKVNAAKAIAALGTIITDTQAPSVPANLTASTVSSSQINLSWSASTDNVGVAGYNVYRNGVKVATVPGTSYSNTGLSGATTYAYTVNAFDAAGNTSAQSTAVNATTPAAPAPSVSITSFQVTEKTINSAKITWTTNIPSTGSISYGTSRNSLTLSATDGQVATSHTVNLTNLNKGATYYYKIISTSQDGTSNTNTAVSSFKTARK
jgi:thermitase